MTIINHCFRNGIALAHPSCSRRSRGVRQLPRRFNGDGIYFTVADFVDATLRVVTRQGEKRFWGSAITLIRLYSKRIRDNNTRVDGSDKFRKLNKWEVYETSCFLQRDSKDTKESLIMSIIAAIYILRLTSLNFQNTLNFYGVDMTKVDQSQPLTRYATSLPIL